MVLFSACSARCSDILRAVSETQVDRRQSDLCQRSNSSIAWPSCWSEMPSRRDGTNSAVCALHNAAASQFMVNRNQSLTPQKNLSAFVQPRDIHTGATCAAGRRSNLNRPCMPWDVACIDDRCWHTRATMTPTLTFTALTHQDLRQDSFDSLSPLPSYLANKSRAHAAVTAALHVTRTCAASVVYL